MKDAVAEFEKADQLETAYLKSESIPARYHWHYRHNLSLLGSLIVGRDASADGVLHRSFDLEGAMPTDVDLDRKQWVMLLLAMRRPAEALTAARSLVARPQPLVQALGHLLAGRAQLALKRPDEAAKEGDLAVRQMRAAGPAPAGCSCLNTSCCKASFCCEPVKSKTAARDAAQCGRKTARRVRTHGWVMTLFSLKRSSARRAILARGRS